MASNTTSEYKIVTDKLVSPDEDIIVEIVGGIYKGTITEQNRYALISDLLTNADITESKLLVEIGPYTFNYTLELADLNKVVSMNGTALTVFIPLESSVAFPIGAIVHIYNLNASTFTVSGVAGVTVRNGGTVTQYSTVTLRKRAANEWVMQL